MKILHGKEETNQQAGSKEALRGRSGEGREERERGGLVSEFNRMSLGEVTVRFLSIAPKITKPELCLEVALLHCFGVLPERSKRGDVIARERREDRNESSPGI